ncbi:MAG: flagellar biosynthesis anti-sigma factor FlgM [Desulfobacteraceae bacterium]|nr:flagellar biosynthesis anti-sigma factor FlgM [Desulfobacteraceae bacterium]
MKINPAQGIKQFESIQKKQNTDAAEKTAQAKEGDKVVFSKEVQQAQGKQNDMSVDTQRQARLQEVKEQIANGSYSPDSFKVAESLLKYIAESGNNG